LIACNVPDCGTTSSGKVNLVSEFIIDYGNIRWLY
jgi:hypothetical protein